MRATLTIDLDAITANWRALDALSGGTVETAAVVKADAYGLGVAPVATALAAKGVTTFFVALCEEGVTLREAVGSDPQIFVFGGLMSGDAALVKAASLIPLLNSPEQVQQYQSDLRGCSAGLQLDTGMNRLGLEPRELEQVLPMLAWLAPRLVISHLACADDPADPANIQQRDAFDSHSGALAGLRRSLAATGGTLLGAPFHYDMTRPGIGLYGGLPFAGAQPVVTLDLPVIQVRDVAEGEGVGYGLSWQAKHPSRIATLSAGYADGLFRGIGAGINAYARDIPCPLVGRISMDLITVDVTELPDVPDTLSLLNAHQGIDDLAAAAGTIGYEVLTALGVRYARVYKGG